MDNIRLLNCRADESISIDYKKHVLMPRLIFGILVVIYPLMVLLFEYTGGSDWGGDTQITRIILGFLTSLFLLTYASFQKNFMFTVVGIAFLAGSVLDSFFLFVFSPWTHQFLGISTPFILMQISGVYLTSSVILGIILIAAPLLHPKAETIAVFFSRKSRLILEILLMAAPVALICWRLPLQKYFDPERIFSRPVDLLPAVLFAVALWVWGRQHLRQPGILSSWMVISLGLLVISQFLLSMSGARFDFYFQLSLGYRHLATLAPVCGLIFEYFIGIDRLQRDLSRLRREHISRASASLAKSEFITHLSHEIRTPINGIIGLTDLVMETPPSFQQRQYLQMLRSSAHQLLHPLGEILDLARIEAGHLELEQKDFGLRELLDSISDTVIHQVDEKGLELTMLVQHDVPDHLTGDPRRFKQVLTNLLDNAIKFSQSGVIAVKIYQTEKGRSKVRLHVTVSDQGIGIAPEFHEVIFNRFTQANTEIFRKYGGTGLGLTLARKILTEMGGEIRVESVPGKGSTFHFTAILGLQKVEKKSEIQRDMRQAEILIIDSNRTTRESLKEMLQAFECQVLEAVDETEALEILAQTEDIQLIICDYQMSQPVATSFVRRVRNLDAYRELPVIFLISIVADQDTSELESLPWLWFTSKPVKQSQLFNVLMAAMNSATSIVTVPEEVASTQSLALKKMTTAVRILLVEDNPINQTVARSLLNKSGVFIDVVENGQRALDILMQKPFDIILMDVQMPEMDGLEATQKIREKLELKDIPIIAITAHALKGDRERCLAAGMNDYISKPVQPEQLYRIINKYLVEKIRINMSGVQAPE